MGRPIIFSGPMVRALLEGRKTMTRRLIKWNLRDSGINLNFSGLHAIPLRTNGTPPGVFLLESHGQSGCWEERGTVKTYAVGDRLYVRETWRAHKSYDIQAPGGIPKFELIQYEADETLSGNFGKKRPGIHMPKWASRLTLIVTAVKVERLQDISIHDALAEGIGPPVAKTQGGNNIDLYPDYVKGPGNGTVHPTESFKSLWQSLNAKRAPWEGNPWVVAPSFTVAKINIERMAT